MFSTKSIALTLCLMFSVIGHAFADGVLTGPASAGTATGTASRSDAATAAGHSHTTSATITLTPTVGQYVYLTGLDISNCQTTTGVTPAAPTYITTTNITGSPQYQLGSGLSLAAGGCNPVSEIQFSTPVRSTAVTTAVTFVLPAFATNQVVSVNVYWYSAP
jgi:hypothetical protein